MKRVPGAIVMAGLLLAACGSPEPAAERESGNGQGGAAASPSAAEKRPEAASAPAAPPSPRTLPAALQGRWGLVPADCDPANAAMAKGLMVVGPATLTFYEARATVVSATAGGEGGVTARLAFSGEGQDWTTETRFTPTEDGKGLVRTDKGWENGTFRYRICPA